jgi:hypothetical protein
VVQLRAAATEEEPSPLLSLPLFPPLPPPITRHLVLHESLGSLLMPFEPDETS